MSDGRTVRLVGYGTLAGQSREAEVLRTTKLYVVVRSGFGETKYRRKDGRRAGGRSVRRMDLWSGWELAEEDRGCE